MWIWLGMAFVAGAASAVQAAFNGHWNKTVGLPLTLMVNAAIVMIGAALLPIFSRGTFSSENLSKLDWTVIIGGVCGLVLIAAMAMSAPKIGVALTVALFVLGQAVLAVSVEHFGLFGQAVRRIDFVRVIGIVLLVGGVVLIQWRR